MAMPLQRALENDDSATLKLNRSPQLILVQPSKMIELKLEGKI
jgi:hypothetical protein